MKQDETKTVLLLCLVFSFPVIYLALAAAPYLGDGLGGMLQGMMLALEKANLTLCKDSLKTVLLFLLVYAGSIGIYFSMQKNYRRGAEHGSAKWGNPQAVNKKYMQKPPKENKILTQQVRIGLDGRKHRRNLNVIVIGGSGAGKTRFYGKPNIMQANTSFVVTDPKGEILRDTGHLLQDEGYEVRVVVVKLFCNTYG